MYIITTRNPIFVFNGSERHTVSIFKAQAGACFSETSASTDESTRRKNPEKHLHHHRRRENLKFHLLLSHFQNFAKNKTLD
jgi:DNA-directed RNA polymerase beta subunit